MKDWNKMENDHLFKFTDRELFESLASSSIDILYVEAEVTIVSTACNM